VDRVEDEVRDRERPVDPRRGEVADRDLDVLGAGLGSQPRHHRLGEVDSANTYAALCERQCDPARPNSELERGAGAGQVGEEVDNRVDGGRLEHVGGRFVVPLGHALAEVVFGHLGTLSKGDRRPKGGPGWPRTH
jgi:hypothetical protein